MTVTEERPRASEREFAGDGGVPARRAVVRWAWRLFRREWRAQALVFALLTFAVAAAIWGSAAAYNLTPAAGNAEFGTANHWLDFNEPDPTQIQADVAAAEAYFGDVDVITRRFVSVPGLFDQLELRAQDPQGLYGAPMLALAEGRYPEGTGELALTAGLAQALNVGVGDTLEIDNAAWAVVGTVENPSDLNDEFALVTSSPGGAVDEMRWLIDADEAKFQAFHPPSQTPTQGAGRPNNEDVLAASGVLAAGAVVLMLVGLIAAAGFVVIARRRLRQLGMLAAIGATERHLRLVMVANGVVIGVLAALSGAGIGLLAWVAAVPGLERASGHRIATFDVPWWLIGSGMLLAVLSASGAAWWPARAIARTSIVSAVSGRPDRPRPAKRSAAAAALLVVAGTACLVLAGDPVDTWLDVGLTLAGIVTLVVGVLFSSPLAIQALARLRGPAPVAVRLALTDLVRYRARSGTALAAISLAIGIATVIVVSASAAMYGAASEGNLSDHQLMIRIGEIPGDGDVAQIEERTPAELVHLREVVAQFATTLDATVIEVEVATDTQFDEFEGLPAVVVGTPVEEGPGTSYRTLSHVYVASPALLEHYGLHAADIDPEADVLTTRTEVLFLLPMRNEPVDKAQHLTPSYTSLPGTFITPEALANRGWTSATAGWLVETADPITPAQFADVRDVAAAAGVTVEIRHDQRNLATLRTGAAGAGGLIALAIMAMTVGLVRSEAAGDLRILTASGATSSNRRTLTAATAGALALLGTLLGVAGAYLGLGAAHFGHLSALTPVPVLHLVVLVVGLPLVAAGAGWVLAGRAPAWLGRQPLD